jgi:hypothetical protein
MNNLMKHAKRELLALGYDPNQIEEDPNKWMQEDVLELIEVFSKQGHSGHSAPYCIRLFAKLALFEPACPLTGEQSEWNEVEKGKLWQNNRCSHVFKDAAGNAYDNHGKVFREPNGDCYISLESRVPIVFPYIPKTEYVDRADEK